MIYSSLLHIGVLCIPGYTFATEVTKSENPVKGHYIVTLDDERRKLSSSSLENLIHKIIQGPDDGIGAQSHGTVDQVYDSVFPGFAADLDEAGLLNVLENEHVVSVEEDGYVQLDQATWGLDRIDDEDLPLDKTYEPTFGNNGEGVTAYIIDTGILHTHTEFEGRATQEYNSVSGEPNTDCNGHGTHVAGTVGSKTYGVANKAKLVGVKVLSCSGSGTWSGVIAGINWVAQNAKKPATANMSLGGGKSTSVNAAVKALVASGVSTVVAAGNSNQDACSYSPASEPDAITVGSTTNTDTRSSFSNWGKCLDIFAPGSSITAPWIGSNTAVMTISGTSMASPHVCGGAALYLGQNPNLTPTDLLNKMLEDSIADTIEDVGNGSPNKFLYVASSQSVVKKCSTNGKKCLSVEKLSFDSSEDDLLKVKFDFRPMMKWQKDTKQVVVVKGGEKPNNTNTYASKNVRRRKQTLLFDLASLVSKMPDGVGSLDIYFVKGGTVVYPETMISINVVSGPPPTSSPTMSPVSGPPPTSSPTMSPETKLGDVTAKDISLNSKPGREIQLKKGSGNVNVNLSAQISGRCGNGCPSCVKAVKLALFNPLNKRIKDKCHSEHSGSQCSFKVFNENYSIDTNLAGKWEVRVEGRWAWCSDGLDNFGTLVNIVVE